MSELEQEENRRFKTERYFPFITGSLKTIWGFGSLEVIRSKFYSSTLNLNYAGRFKIEYSEKRRRFVYVRIYSGTLHLRDIY